MIILFKTTKLEKLCNDEKLMIKRYGPLRSKLLKRRLNELRATNVLEDIRKLPQARCHELFHNRKGQLSVDLDHPYRLIFEPANNPVPMKSGGELDWTKVTEITIIGMEDTHD
jgi:proteic killer suppression protein